MSERHCSKAVLCRVMAPMVLLLRGNLGFAGDGAFVPARLGRSMVSRVSPNPQYLTYSFTRGEHEHTVADRHTTDDRQQNWRQYVEGRSGNADRAAENIDVL
jgi:hypothetical protein